jgi:hypothetical protein
MMPETRKMKRACRTAPAKIHPKSRKTGSETSWIQRGMSRTALLGDGAGGASGSAFSC